MSVNVAWKGRRFKTDEYKAYRRELLLRLSQVELPDPPFTLVMEFGVSNPVADWDNPIKPLQDILQDAYGFNDKKIYEGVGRKVLVPKGQEYIRFRFLPLVDLSCLFEIGEDQLLEVVSKR